MSLRNVRLIGRVITLLSFAGIASPGVTPLHAQAPAHFKALSVPPPDVGTCIEPAKMANRRSQLRLSPRLVITHRAPGARRELSIFRDSTGSINGFTETVNVTDERLSVTSEAVVAFLGANEHVSGQVMRTGLVMPDTGLRALDSTSLAAAHERMLRATTRSELDALGQRQVRILATWLATRCPG